MSSNAGQGREGELANLYDVTLQAILTQLHLYAPQPLDMSKSQLLIISSSTQLGLMSLLVRTLLLAIAASKSAKRNSFISHAVCMCP
ncbi:hypothetical protein FCV25MIE_34608 [Fagus crenata]